MRLESAKKLSEYLLQILDYMEELCRFLALLHEKGYILHDLTPDNIMLTADNHIKLIDLEGCTPIEQRGKFMGKTVYDTLLKSDYPDLCELGMMLFASLIKKDDLLSLKTDTVSEFLAHIQKYYTLPEKLVKLILTLTSTQQQPPILEIRADLLDIKEQIIAGKVKYIPTYNMDLSVDYKRIIRANISAVKGLYKKANGLLFPTTPVVSNELNITNGYIGVAKVLNHLGYIELNDECAEMCEEITEGIPSGLYVGAAGCVWTLLEQNNLEAAQRLYRNKCSLTLNEGEDDYSIYSGKSGIGLIGIMLYYRTGDKKYLTDAAVIGNQVLTSYNPDLNSSVGYKAGNTGISLFLLHLSLASKDSRYIKYGLNLLERDLNQYKRQDNSIHICFPGDIEGRVVFPYFMEGTAGILSVLLRYWAVLRNDKLKDTAVTLANGLHYGFSVSATLYYGMAGIGNTLLDCAYYLSDEKYKLWATELAEGCAKHMIAHEEYGIVFPDVYNRKISVDFGNGGLGVIMFFDRYTKNSKSNFAIPLDDEFIRAIHT